MTMKNLRVGVIGAGMGRHHASSFQGHACCEVIALADPDEAKCNEVADTHNVPKRFATAEEMLEKEDLDIVSIATPNKFHRPLTIAALEKGCHVLCEKPMALNAAEAEDMLNAARQAGRRLMINFSYRFMPQSQALKDEMDRGTLGDIYFARTVWLRRKGLPRFGGWFGQKELSGGGPLIDLGVHRLDLALWLMGYPKPAWVMASAYDHLARELAEAEGKSFDVEDLAVGFIKFRNGATLGIEASWAGHIKEKELMHTRLMGTKGGLVQYNLNEGYEFAAEIFTERDGVRYNITPAPPFPPCPGPMEHFADAIINDTPHIATGEEGLVVMQLLDAIYESAEKGEPVKIAE